MDNILKVLNKLETIDEVRDVINHVNENQMASKDWLLERLPECKSPVVLGGWYGYLASILSGVSVDSNPECERIGKKLYPQVDFRTMDAFDYLDTRLTKHDLIVCTSCEHMDQTQLSLITARKKKHTFIAFQSNNYYGIEGHINCKATLEEFIADYDLREYHYIGELDRGHYKRWMIIGK